MSEPVLEVRGLTRSYRTGAESLTVLRETGLSLSRGEIVGLVGPSGCGKSSLLHAIGLLERPDAGEVTLDGEAALDLPDRRRTQLRRDKIGFIYQFHHLLAEFSALDNVAMPRLVAGASRSVAREAASALLDAIGLGARKSHQPGELSGGERQRVAIARALVNDPVLLLADEPTGNLDPDTSETVFTLLTQSARERGLTALIATHNIDLAQKTDRVLTIRDERITALE